MVVFDELDKLDPSLLRRMMGSLADNPGTLTAVTDDGQMLVFNCRPHIFLFTANVAMDELLNSVTVLDQQRSSIKLKPTESWSYADTFQQLNLILQNAFDGVDDAGNRKCIITDKLIPGISSRIQCWCPLPLYTDRHLFFESVLNRLREDYWLRQCIVLLWSSSAVQQLVYRSFTDPSWGLQRVDAKLDGRTVLRIMGTDLHKVLTNARRVQDWIETQLREEKAEELRVMAADMHLCENLQLELSALENQGADSWLLPHRVWFPLVLPDRVKTENTVLKARQAQASGLPVGWLVVLRQSTFALAQLADKLVSPDIAPLVDGRRRT